MLYKTKLKSYIITSILSVFIFSLCNIIFGENIQNLGISAIQTTKNIDIDEEDQLDYIPGEVLVQYKDTTVLGLKMFNSDDASIKKLEKSISNDNLEIQEVIEEDNLAILGIQDDKTVEETIEILQENSRIESAQPNFIYTIHDYELSENPDPDQDKLRGLDSISRYDAYNIFSGTDDTSITGVTVGVIDVGVNPVHPDLSSQMWNGNGCLDDQGNELGDCNYGFDFGLENPYRSYPIFASHGTHIAGIIAATINNGTGIIGVNPKAKIASLKIDGPWGNITTLTAIKAINFAKYNGIKILNASRGGNIFDTGLYNAIKSYGENGGLIIISAGNSKFQHNNDTEGHIYPCDFDLDNIICVAAINENEELAYYSHYGSNSVDIAAPGSSIYSTIFNTGRWLVKDFPNTIISMGNIFESDTIFLPENRDYDISFDLNCNYGGVLATTFNIYDGDELIASEQYYPFYETESTLNTRYYYFTDLSDFKSGFKFSFELLGHEQNDIQCDMTNIRIEKSEILPQDLSGQLYGYMDGTSMAAPHVAGLASLARSFRPDLTYTEIIQAILENGDYLESLSGKLVNSKKINAYNTLFALDNFSPSTPIIVSPDINTVYDETESTDINLERNQTTDKGVGISGYTIEIANNIDFESSQIYTSETTGLIINLNSLNTGKIYRRVQAFDKKSNTGLFSDISYFTIGIEYSGENEETNTLSNNTSTGDNEITDTGTNQTIIDSGPTTGEYNTGELENSSQESNIGSGDSTQNSDSGSTNNSTSETVSSKNTDTQPSGDSSNSEKNETENESKEEKEQYHFSPFDYRYISSAPQSIQPNGYTTEMNNAYRFALLNKITTTSSINEANMDGDLTRIAMAKMLSNYAINILGKDLNADKSCNFGDISSSLDSQYDNGAKHACQLGIMGIDIDNFRPYDTVTRAEFATALSRLLYNTKDGSGNYYTTHIQKLYNEKIISNTTPTLQETRGYVMLMLMRSAMDNN